MPALPWLRTAIVRLRANANAYKTANVSAIKIAPVTKIAAVKNIRFCFSINIMIAMANATAEKIVLVKNNNILPVQNTL